MHVKKCKCRSDQQPEPAAPPLPQHPPVDSCGINVCYHSPAFIQHICRVSECRCQTQINKFICCNNRHLKLVSYLTELMLENSIELILWMRLLRLGLREAFNDSLPAS